MPRFTKENPRASWASVAQRLRRGAGWLGRDHLGRWFYGGASGALGASLAMRTVYSMVRVGLLVQEDDRLVLFDDSASERDRRVVAESGS